MGALEQSLADRVALTLWRLERFARAEALAIAADFADTLLPNPPCPYGSPAPGSELAATIRSAKNKADELKFDLNDTLWAVRCLERLPGSADADATRWAFLAVRAAWDVAKCRMAPGTPTPRGPRKLAVLARGEPWTAGHLRRALSVLAERAGVSTEWLSDVTLTSRRFAAQDLREKWDDARAKFAGLTER